MKTDNMKSSALLPGFAHGASFCAVAFDSIGIDISSRAISLAAPLTLESTMALTDEEMQEMYEMYGIAKYYPDISKERRAWLLTTQNRYWRRLGTPKALETLVQYLFDDITIHLTVVDNLAFNTHGTLVNGDLLDTYDAVIEPEEPAVTEEINSRLYANLVRFSRNSQQLRGVTYHFDAYIYTPVCVKGQDIYTRDYGLTIIEA